MAIFRLWVHNGPVHATSDFDLQQLFSLGLNSKLFYPTPVLDASTISPSFSSLDITDSDVFEVLSSLDTSKAMGVDGIAPSILKYCLYQPLHHLFLASLSYAFDSCGMEDPSNYTNS